MDVSPGTTLPARTPRRKRRTSRLPPAVPPPLLLTPDFVERVEDVAAILTGVVLRAVQPVRSDHVENLILVFVLPFPRVADDVAPGCPADPLTDAEDGVDVRLEVPSSVPAEDELVGVDVDMLVAPWRCAACYP